MTKKKQIFDKQSIQSSSNVIVNIKHKEDSEVNELPGYSPQECDTNIESSYDLCWNCCHSFDNRSVAYPMKYENEIFYTHGHFCSYNCCARYVLDTYPEKQKWEYYSLLNLYMNMCNDTIGKSIVPAPQRILLKSFGGNLSIEEFRQVSGENVYNIDVDPIIPIVPINHSHSKLLQQKKVEETKEKYKLYRKSALNKQNDIYQTMNLVTDAQEGE
tara:strand:- start:16406 stop:17050 length:645 start_codon:yes stop_codon:yes gene_type:complete